MFRNEIFCLFSLETEMALVFFCGGWGVFGDVLDQVFKREALASACLGYAPGQPGVSWRPVREVLSANRASSVASVRPKCVFKFLRLRTVTFCV